MLRVFGLKTIASAIDLPYAYSDTNSLLVNIYDCQSSKIKLVYYKINICACFNGIELKNRTLRTSLSTSKHFWFHE